MPAAVERRRAPRIRATARPPTSPRTAFNTTSRTTRSNDTYAFDPQIHAEFPERPRRLADALWEHSAGEDEYLKHVAARRGYDAFDFARRVSVPALVAVGEADTVARGSSTPLAASKRLAQTLPQSELLLVPRVRHMLYWERPEAIGPPVLEFLARS